MSPGNGEHPPRDPRQLDGLDTYPVAQVEALVERIDELEAENKALRDRFSDADTERNGANLALKTAFSRIMQLEERDKQAREDEAWAHQMHVGCIAREEDGWVASAWNVKMQSIDQANAATIHEALRDLREKVEWGAR